MEFIPTKRFLKMPRRGAIRILGVTKSIQAFIYTPLAHIDARIASFLTAADGQILHRKVV
jgi:hypothetical protein